MPADAIPIAILSPAIEIGIVKANRYDDKTIKKTATERLLSIAINYTQIVFDFQIII